MLSYSYVQPDVSNYSSYWRVCIYKKIWAEQYFHAIVPAYQSCPFVTADSKLVYQFYFPCF
ncbi:hypothetical protein COL01_11420 [Bacillus thuringiensis]|nr:hypothetical protein COL01_11420 [Bacillus thuringiensis]